MYVFVARCVAYHFNAKQPTDMARRQVKVTKHDLSRIKERFQAFLKGETNIPTDEAFAKAMHSYCEVFRCNVEKRIRSLPDIEGLSKDTVLNSWMAKFDTITKGDEEAQGRNVSSTCASRATGCCVVNARSPARTGPQSLFRHLVIGDKRNSNCHMLLNGECNSIILQLDNPDEQAAAIRREVATREDACKDIQKMRKIMPKFVVKDMETLFMDEVRQSINLLISNLESVPVTPRGQAVGKRKDKSRSAVY
ncbi:hypothetical protein ANCCEY_07503 [Ancylostoma ceylanicum]|uniref:Uncharacterized protein n=1 Tax=Ancylostoma ceylanicum TaxID=53326 RepID=A0A0D6LMV5_9BILA|nr:hypothetical protein ANCCEY_07503 [Ancylostoma ceylanicum]